MPTRPTAPAGTGNNDLIALEARVGRLEQALADNTASTRRVESNTTDLVEAFSNLKAALKVLNWIAACVKPLGYIAAAIAAMVGLYTAFKAGTVIK